jgi:hypothetical protein
VSPGRGEIALGHLDGDNRLDFVIASAESNRVGVGRNLGDGTFGAPINYTVTSPDGIAPARSRSTRPRSATSATW